MGWLIRTLGAAVITGIGFKLGGDIYTKVKKRFGQDEAGTTSREEGPIEAEVVDAAEDEPGRK
jgi:hypothetical protein